MLTFAIAGVILIAVGLIWDYNNSPKGTWTHGFHWAWQSKKDPPSSHEGTEGND